MENYTVTELSETIRHAIQSEFKGKSITVTGEISNAKHSGRHSYLTLKDDNASISVAFWGNSIDNPNGDHVEITGKIDYYTKSGYVNLIGAKIKSIGIGALHTEYERLKQEYEKKGYFDNQRSPPDSVKKIGVVTSEGGAALHDFLYALKQKGFTGDVYIYDCIVQGPRCPASVAAGIKFFNSPFYPPKQSDNDESKDDSTESDNDSANDSANDSTDDSSDQSVDLSKLEAKKTKKDSNTLTTKNKRLYDEEEDGVEVDLIIITRGGGSFEDLMGFSHSKVIEAIHASKKYTVSAVGHEVDSMLSDYVANHREPTPSFAGDFVCKIGDHQKRKLELIESTIVKTKHEMLQALYKYKNYLKRLDISIENPKLTVESKLNEVHKRATSHIRGKLSNYTERLSKIRETIISNDITKIFDIGFVAITNDDGDLVTDMSKILNKTVFISNGQGQYKVTVQHIDETKNKIKKNNKNI